MYGVGPTTASRALAKMQDTEEFLNDLLEAKLKYVTTRAVPERAAGETQTVLSPSMSGLGYYEDLGGGQSSTRRLTFTLDLHPVILGGGSLMSGNHI